MIKSIPFCLSKRVIIATKGVASSISKPNLACKLAFNVLCDFLDNGYEALSIPFTIPDNL